MRRLLPAILFFAATISHAAITGTTIDEDGSPVAGAIVRAFAVEPDRSFYERARTGKIEPLATATSNEEGAFSIDIGSAPVANVAFTANGRQLVVVPAAATDDLGAVLLRTGAPVRGTVTAAGKPVAGARITLRPGITITSSEDGSFEAPSGVPVGVVFHPGFAPALVHSVTGSLEVKLDKGTTLRGRVIDERGKPVARSKIESNTIALGESGEDGSFTFENVPEHVRVVSAATGESTGTVRLQPGGPVEIRLLPAGKLTGTLRDSKGNPVAGMLLTFLGGNAAGPVNAVTDAKGNFALSAVAPGQYHVAGFHPAFQLMHSGPISVVAGERAALSLTSAVLPRLRGVVIDERKKSIRAATVTAALDREVVTDTRGAFSLRVRVPQSSGTITSPVRVQAQKKGYATSGKAVLPNRDGQFDDVVITLSDGFPLVVKVTDEEGKPVERAVATMREHDVEDGGGFVCRPPGCTTGTDGTFTVTIASGEYDISVRAPGMVFREFKSENLTPKSSPLLLSLERGVEVSGRVIDTDERPVAEVQVIANNRFLDSARTDGEGRFTLRNLPRGPLQISAQVIPPSGGSPWKGAPKEVTAPATDVVLTVPKRARIRGTVVDDAGKPLQTFSVGALRSGQGLGRLPSVSSQDGTFSLDVMPGVYDVEASAAGYTRKRVTNVDTSSDAAPIQIRLSRAARVRGRVVDSSGAPLSRVAVQARVDDMGRMPMMDSASTDANGDFVLDQLEPGRRSITFHRQDYVPAEKSVDLSSDVEARLEVTLEKGLELRGRVVDEAGRPVEGADVRLESTGGAARSDAAGEFRIGGLRNRNARLAVRKEGFTPLTGHPVDASVTTEITLKRGGTVTGRITGLSESQMRMVFVSGTGGAGGPGVKPDVNGAFTISGLPEGPAGISAYLYGSGPGRSVHRNINVVNGKADPIELAFDSGFTIRGKLTVNRGLPVGNAGVFFSNPAGGMAGSVEADGSYSVVGLPGGDYTITASSSAIVGQYTGKASFNGDAIHDIDLPASRVAVKVADGTGSPVSGAQVSFFGHRGNRRELTDGQGRVETLVVAGRIRIDVQKAGYGGANRDLVVGSEPQEIEIRINSGTELAVAVVDARDGSPISGASVNALDANRKTVYSANTSSGDGIARLWLASGRYQIGVGSRGYVYTAVPLDAPVATLRVALRPAGTLAIECPDAAAKFVLFPPGQSGTAGSPRPATTMRRFESLAPGTWSVERVDAQNRPIDRRDVVILEAQTTTVKFP